MTGALASETHYIINLSSYIALKRNFKVTRQGPPVNRPL